MPRSPLWIAGAGAICAAGADLPSILRSFEIGRRNPTTDPADHSSIDCPTFQVIAELPILPGRYSNSRSLRLAMHAVNEAMAQAGIKWFDPTTRIGVCIGTTVASQLNCIPFYQAYRQNAHPPLDPVYDYLHANLAQAIGSLLNIHGPRMTIVNACSSGTDSIGVAMNWLRAGLCDIAIAGGADEINRVAMAGFWSLGVMSNQPCAPFDRDRAGLNLGEGAGILLLETDEHAQRRGATPRFEVAGFGAGSDAHHLTAPHPQGRGLESAIATALKMADIHPTQISFINAHGTATTDNDRAEGKVIDRIFGQKIPFLSTKGYTGHTLGAAGGIEAAFTLAALEQGWIPPSAGFQNQSDEIPVAPTKEKTKITGNYAISTSLAFGGNNSAVIIRKCERYNTDGTEKAHPERSGTPAQSKHALSEVEGDLASSDKVPQEIKGPTPEQAPSTPVSTPPLRTIQTDQPTIRRCERYNTDGTEKVHPERSGIPAQSKHALSEVEGDLASNDKEPQEIKGPSTLQQGPSTPVSTPPLRTIPSDQPTTTPQQNLPPAHILGIGAVTPLGRDLQTIAQRLASPPAETPSAFRVSDETFADPAISRRLRRADRFTRMATVSAIDAWSAAKTHCTNISMDRVGLIIATGFGPHPRGFKFLDGILDCGDADALPTDFSHSVHGAAAAYITEILELRGRCLTTTDFEMPFEQAILLAQCWLDQKICDRVLVGAVEELGEVMLHCAQQMAPGLTPGEGAMFLTLAPTGGARTLHTTQTPPRPPRFSGSEKDFKRVTGSEKYFGHSPIDTAFHLLPMLLSEPEVDTPSTHKPLSNGQTISLVLTRTTP